MSKSGLVIQCIQQQYHYSLGQVYTLFPELRKLVHEEELTCIARKARVTRYKLIKR